MAAGQLSRDAVEERDSAEEKENDARGHRCAPESHGAPSQERIAPIHTHLPHAVPGCRFTKSRRCGVAALFRFPTIAAMTYGRSLCFGARRARGS